MGLWGFANFLGKGTGIMPSSTPSIRDVVKTVETIDALITDQVAEGKKEGYSDAALEYELVYADLKETYEKLILDIENKRTSLDVTSKCGLIELETLEAESARLKKELNDKVNTASKTFCISESSILSALNSGSSSFFTCSLLCSVDLRGSIIAEKKKERMQARKEGYLEAKALYEEKINQLKDHYRKTKADADVKLSNYANHVSDLLSEIETLRFQIADLRIAMNG